MTPTSNTVAACSPDSRPARLSSTLLLDARDVAGMIATHGLATCIAELSNCIRADFLRWPDFDKSARSAAHSRDGVIELMPIADTNSYSFKYVNGHPKNAQYGLPTVMAFGALADVATGFPLMLCELTLLTALRTAATSVLAAQWLARPDSHTMALIGNGAQSEFQAVAFHHVLGIKHLRVFDVDSKATDKLCRNLTAYPDLIITRCNSAEEAIEGADIVTTITADKRNATIITPAMIRAGTHYNAVGGDCPGKTELHADVLRAAQVFVEYEPQSRIEGDVQQMPADFPVTEFWRVLDGQVSARHHATQITVFDSVGFALEDYSSLRWLYEKAQRKKAQPFIELIPNLDDTKDLYALLLENARERKLSLVSPE